jgi:serine/threonine-protein kinase
MHDLVSWKGQELAAGRYRLTDHLGEGGMGVVYRAWDKNLKTEVVIKVPKAAGLGDGESIRRFLLEARSLVQLAHPHVVTILDVGEHAGLPFLVMQFLAGGNLKDRQPRGVDHQPRPAPPQTLGAWLPDVAAALDFMHHRGYVHRDVKPANILFDAENHAYISDFGISKCLAPLAGGPRTDLTGVGRVSGTPAYMAPEMVFGGAFDGRADQYSLAVSVYELLAGHGPFEGLSLPQVALRQKAGPPTALDRVNPSVASGTSWAVGKALSVEPGQRFPSCAAFAQAALAAESAPRPARLPPRPASPAPLPTLPPRPPRRKPARPAAVLALFALVAAGLLLLCLASLAVAILRRSTF